MESLAQLAGLTVVLLVGLASIVALSYRSYIADNWDQSRCEPGVIPLAGLFKPTDDPRTAAEFAADNWSFCQREYVQDAIRVAANAPATLAEATTDTVAAASEMAGVTGDIFADLWHFCHDVYRKFMGQMATTATLFRNFMIRLYSLVDRLQGSALSIVYSLIAVIVGIVNSIHVTVMAAVIVVGIMIALQIILFFLIWPISGLLATVAAMVNVVVISMATAVAGATGELFSGGSAACFTSDSPIRMADGSFKPIAEIRVGDMLYGPGSNRVTAVHRSVTKEAVYAVGSVRVTGNHLIYQGSELCYVKHLPLSVRGAPLEEGVEKLVWCLTTGDRKIPTATETFADWEEMAEDDVVGKTAWYYDVLKSLNDDDEGGLDGLANPFHTACVRGLDVEGDHRSLYEIFHHPREPTPAILGSDAGFSQNTKVLMSDGQWTPISEIRIGDRICSNERFKHSTPVTGVVEIEGDLETDAIALGSAIMTPSVWVREDGDYKAAAFHSSATPVELHPVRWYHLYTACGTFIVQGSLTVRDAAEVEPREMEWMVTKHIIIRK